MITLCYLFLILNYRAAIYIFHKINIQNAQATEQEKDSPETSPIQSFVSVLLSQDSRTFWNVNWLVPSGAHDAAESTEPRRRTSKLRPSNVKNQNQSCFSLIYYSDRPSHERRPLGDGDEFRTGR